MLEQVDQRPADVPGRRLVAGPGQHQHQVDHHQIRHPGAVLVPGLGEQLQEVRRVGRLPPALLDQPAERHPQPVASPPAAHQVRQRQPGRRHRVHAGGEPPELLEELQPHPAPEVRAEESVRGDPHDQRTECGHQVDRAALPELVREHAGLLLHHRDVVVHLPALEPREHDLPLPPVLVRRAEHVEVRIEHPREVRHPVAHRQPLVGLGEEEPVVLRTEQHHGAAADQPHGEHPPVLPVAALQHGYRITHELQRVAQHRSTTGHRRG